MNFKFINKLFIILIFYLVYSCQTIENFTNNDDNQEFEVNKSLIEKSDIINLTNTNNLSPSFIDFYTNDLS